MNKGLLPDTITIGLENHLKELTEQVANIEGMSINMEVLMIDCFDWAKLYLSEQFVLHLLQKRFGNHLDITPEEGQEISAFTQFSRAVWRVVQYLESQIIGLQLVDQDSYVPYRMIGMLGLDTIVLEFRPAIQTNLENPGSKRFDPQGHVSSRRGNG